MKVCFVYFCERIFIRQFFVFFSKFFLALKNFGYPDINILKVWNFVKDIWCCCPFLPEDILVILSKEFIFQRIALLKEKDAHISELCRINV